MPVPAHSRLTFSGVVLDTQANVPLEEWSFSVKSASLGTSAPDDTSGLQGDAEAARAAYVAHVKPEMPHWTVLTNVRCSMHAAGGLTRRTTDGSYLHADAPAAVAGGSEGLVRYPLQSALVVSLQTDRAGATGKGRFFLPCPNVVLGVQFALAQVDQQRITTAMEAFLGALVPTFGDIRVVSSAGVTSVVRSVRVGRVIDTQRSRRSHLQEKYLEVPLSA